MQVVINYWAVLVAALASMFIGFLWYGPLFGKAWIRMMGWSKEDIDKAKAKGMTKSYILMLVGSLVMACVLAHLIVITQSFFNTNNLSLGFQAAFWSWLGFIAPVTISSVIWEGKSWKLWLLNNGYNLVTLIVMGYILAYWK